MTTSRYQCPNCGGYRSDSAGSFGCGETLLWLLALGCALTGFGLIIAFPIWIWLGQRSDERPDRQCKICGKVWTEKPSWAAAAGSEQEEARALLAYLRQNGVTLSVARNGHDLEYQGPSLKSETVANLKRLKPQLLELLKST